MSSVEIAQLDQADVDDDFLSDLELEIRKLSSSPVPVAEPPEDAIASGESEAEVLDDLLEVESSLPSLSDLEGDADDQSSEDLPTMDLPKVSRAADGDADEGEVEVESPAADLPLESVDSPPRINDQLDAPLDELFAQPSGDQTDPKHNKHHQHSDNKQPVLVWVH